MPILRAPRPVESGRARGSGLRGGRAGGARDGGGRRADARGAVAGAAQRTDRPFAINHTIRPFDEDAFEATLRFRPAAISFHIGVFGELVERAHAEGILWIQQVVDRDQAGGRSRPAPTSSSPRAGEAGGHGGWVGRHDGARARGGRPRRCDPRRRRRRDRRRPRGRRRARARRPGRARRDALPRLGGDERGGGLEAADRRGRGARRRQGAALRARAAALQPARRAGDRARCARR